MVAVCAAVRKAPDGSCEDVRVGLTNMGGVPLRATAAEQALRGGGLDARRDRGGGRAGGRGHRPAGRPQRVRGLQAPPGARAVPARAGGGGRGGVSLEAVDDVEQALVGEGYLPDRGLATAVFLAVTLEQPLLLEGEAGVGKTEVARALASATGARLIRLQCHEGIDLHHAVYDWDYQRQLLAIRAAEAGRGGRASSTAASSCCAGRCSRRSRPTSDVVLLIDEVDRADDEFEAFLLEFLADFAVTIPELGTVHGAAAAAGRADVEPHARAARRASSAAASTTGSTTRRASARRRSSARGCPACPRRSSRASAPRSRGCAPRSSTRCPGVGETITWARALLALGPDDDLDATLGVALKVREDIERVREKGVLQVPERERRQPP